MVLRYLYIKTLKEQKMVNVLIADNNINYVKNLMNYINEGNEKIRVTKIAEDGMETLKILNNDKNIDIALLDFDMPGYDANQICKKRGKNLKKW